MDNDQNYPAFKEYPLQSSCIQLIPARAQKGLSTFDVEFTCLDADGNYIAIGSNVGVAYLINRENDNLHKLKDNEHKQKISSIKILVSLECLIAVGFRNGAILVYKVPFQENQELEKFTVEGLHSSAITALEWSKNGMKFFSGDENGIIVCTEIDHFEHQSRSRVLMNERSKVVQLSYNHFNLVISTVFRSLIYSLKTNDFVQIGQKERKCFGPFGAIIFDEQNNTVFASRPGQRLWKSNISGIIQETLIFKNALSVSCPLIETLTKTNENVSFSDFQFERLTKFESFIIIWSDSYVVLIDPDKQLIVTASPKLDPITDVAASNNEIFILRGLRHILRISTEPDVYCSTKAISEEPSLIEDILEPLKGLSTFVKERSDSLSVQTENNTNIFDWLKKKRSASSPADVPNDINESDGVKVIESLPDIVSLDSNECIPVKIEASPIPVNDIPQLITKDFTDGNDMDDLVYKVKKKTKKTKKVQFVIDAAPSRNQRFISSANSKECDSDSSNNEISLNKISNDLPNNEDSLSKISDNVPNALEIKSTLSDSNFRESTSPADKDSQLKTIQNINETSDKIYDDGDKLLENVLIAYSNSKHQGLHSEDLINSNFNDDIHINNENQNINCEYDKDTSNSFSSDINNDNINTDVEESAICNGNKDTDNKQNFDCDEIYSPVSNNNSEAKETSKSEGSAESLSLEDSSISSTSSKNNEPPKYGVNWIQYKAPELLLDISVSDDHIFCVDVRNQIHFSPHPQMGSLNWFELDQPAEKIAASNLETVIWVLYRGTVFTAVHKALCLWENTEWLSIARDVVSIAVDNECGWYAKSNGELVTQQDLSLTKSCNYPQTVPCNSPALQVAIKDGVLWVLTISGSLFARKSTDGKKSKSLWKEIIMKDVPGIDSIYLGYKKTGWIIDSNDFIHFIINVTPETPGGTGQPWMVEASNSLFCPASRANASLEQVVRRTLNSETLTSLIRGKQHLCLSASSMGVWFCKTYDNLLFSNQNSIIGHNWEIVIPPSTAVATKWSLIAADGMNNSEGCLWCINVAGELFCYDIKSKILLPVESPSSSSIQCIQPKYQSLWLLSEDGNIHIRRGITPTCLQGMWWQALPFQIGTQQISHISCSSFVSWACTNNGEIFMRLGSLNPSSSKLNQAWLPIHGEYEYIKYPLDKFSAIGKHIPLPLIPTQFSQNGFCEVYVGPQGYPVWAIDKRRNVYVREGVSTNLPIGEKWTLIPDLHAKQLCISNNAVWLLKSSGNIYRRFGVTEKNPCGDYWKQIPGNLDFITVTEDDDIWGLRDDSIYCHYSFVLYDTVNSPLQKSVQRMISEEGWEDIMADDFEVL